MLRSVTGRGLVSGEAGRGDAGRSGQADAGKGLGLRGFKNEVREGFASEQQESEDGRTRGRREAEDAGEEAGRAAVQGSGLVTSTDQSGRLTRAQIGLDLHQRRNWVIHSQQDH